MTERPQFQVVSPDATPEEVAAIMAAVGAAVAADAQAAAAGAGAGDGEPAVREWVRMSRMVNRRSGMARGSWRLSGCLPRRSRV